MTALEPSLSWLLFRTCQKKFNISGWSHDHNNCEKSQSQTNTSDTHAQETYCTSLTCFLVQDFFVYKFIATNGMQLYSAQVCMYKNLYEIASKFDLQKFLVHVSWACAGGIIIYL